MKFFDFIAKRYTLGILLLAALYWGVARASLLLAIPGSNVSPVWPPSGVALALLLIGGMRWWPAITLGALLANLQGFGAHGGGLTPALYGAASAIAVGNTLEAVVAAGLLRKLVGSTLLFTQARHAMGFAVIAPLACMFSALIGSLSLMAGQAIPADLWSTVLQTWWLGDVLGMVVLMPFLISWYPTVSKRGESYPVHQRVGRELGWVGLLVLAVMVWTFATPFETVAQSRPYAVLLIPSLGVIAWRYGVRGATSAMLGLVVVVVWATSHGHGLLVSGPLHHVLVQLDVLLILLAGMNLLLVADCTEQYQKKMRQAASGLRWREQRLSWSTLCAGCVLSLLGWHWVAQSNESQAQQRFATAVQYFVGELEDRVQSYQQVLIGASSLFFENNYVSPQAWRHFFESQLGDESLQGLQVLGFSQWVEPGQRERLQQEMRQEGFSSFVMHPAGERQAYTSVTRLEPINQSNQHILGFDMWTDPVRRAAMQLASDTGLVAVSSRTKLLRKQASKDQPGFIMYYPVYRNGVRPLTVAEHQKQLLGFVYAPVQMSSFIRTTLTHTNPHLWVEISDVLPTDAYDTATHRLYPAPTQPGEPKAVQIGKFSEMRSIDLGGTTWYLRLASLNGFGVRLTKANLSWFWCAAWLCLHFCLFWCVCKSKPKKKPKRLPKAWRMRIRMYALALSPW